MFFLMEKHSATRNNIYGKRVAIAVSRLKCAFCKCSGCSLALLAGQACPNAAGLFYRETTSIPAAPSDQLQAQAHPEKITGPKIHWECGKPRQGKELRRYLTGNLSWQLLHPGRKAAVTKVTYLPVTFGKMLLGAACALWFLTDTRERCLMIFLSCSTSTGLRTMTMFPPPRLKVGKAAAPAPPAAAPKRNSCPAPVPGSSQRNRPVPPAARPRCPSPNWRAGSSCKTWSWSWKKKWRCRKMTTRNRLKGKGLQSAAFWRVRSLQLMLLPH